MKEKPRPNSPDAKLPPWQLVANCRNGRWAPLGGLWPWPVHGWRICKCYHRPASWTVSSAKMEDLRIPTPPRFIWQFAPEKRMVARRSDLLKFFRGELWNFQRGNHLATGFFNKVGFVATLKSLTLGLFHVFQSGHSYIETEENGSQAKMILVHFPENKAQGFGFPLNQRGQRVHSLKQRWTYMRPQQSFKIYLFWGMAFSW